MIYAATGHRPHKLGNEYDLKGPYSDYIKEAFQKILKNSQVERVISGMALGVDTLWAFTAMELGIPITAAIPFLGQESRWPPSSRKLHAEILKHKLTTVKIVCEGGYAAWKMQKRNEWMVDNCDILVAVWDGTPGGTGNCVAYAKKVDKRILRIDPRDMLKSTESVV